MALSDQEELSLIRQIKAAQEAGDSSKVAQLRSEYESAKHKASFLEENLEIPGGIGGAIGGAALGASLGSAVPIVGTALGGIAGGVIGGALGSAGGSVVEDIRADREIDTNAAMKEAGISVGYDLAFLGAGKVLRPVAKALGFGVADLMSSFSKAEGLKKARTGIVTEGSSSSLQQTQNLLEQGGGSLSAFQTKRAGGLRNFAEGIGDIGILSSSRATSREATNMKALQSEADRILNSLTGESLSANELGRATAGLINDGREAASTLYGKGLEELQTNYGFKQLDTLNLRKPLAALLDEKTLKVGEEARSELANSVVKEVSDALQFLGGGRRISVRDAIRFEKTLNQKVNKLAKIGTEGYDDVASGQLFEFMGRYRKAMAESMENLDPNLAKGYTALKDNYASAMTGLLPTPTAGLIKQANKEQFESLGRALVTANDPDKVSGFMKAIDTAYDQLKKAGGNAYSIKDAAAAKDVIRKSYLQNIFGQDTTQMPVQRLITIAKNLDNGTQAMKAHTILGDAYPDFRRLVNAFADTSQKRGSDHFVLAMRSKEIQGLGAGASFFTGGIGGPLAILFTPVVLSRIATNKGAVRRLLTMKKAIDKNGLAYSAEFVGAWAAKIIDSLDDESREEIRSYIANPPEAEPAQPPQQQQPVQVPQPN